MVDVCIDLSDVVEVSMRNTLETASQAFGTMLPKGVRVPSFLPAPGIRSANNKDPIYFRGTLCVGMHTIWQVHLK